MTPFSSALKFYVKEKNIRTYSMAQYCGIDRSNMYKLLNGKRNPSSEELVERIAEYMRLKPLERERFLVDYQITVMGYENYYRRKNVQDFMLSFSNRTSKIKNDSQYDYAEVKINKEDMKFCDGSIVGIDQLNYLIYCILSLEHEKKEGKICLLMQPEEHNMMNILTMAVDKKTDLSIEHIFCLNNADDIVLNQKDYNVTCLKHILPLFIQGKCEYKPYCYYDNIVSHNNRFHFLSSLLLTSEYAIVFSLSNQYGIFLSDKDSVQYLHKMFQYLKKDTVLIARKIETVEEQLNAFTTIDFQCEGIGFQPEGYLVPMIPPAFVEKYFHADILVHREIKEHIVKYIYNMKDILEQSESIFIFTENGIRKFIESGRITELPESMYTPLKYSDRLLMIKRLIKKCETGNYQMLRPDAPVAECEMCMYSAMRGGYFLFPTSQGDRVFLELRAVGVLHVFRDYFESLDKKYYYSTEEAVEVLKELLKNGKKV